MSRRVTQEMLVNTKPNGRKATPTISSKPAAAKTAAARATAARKPIAAPSSTLHAKTASKRAAGTNTRQLQAVPAAPTEPVGISKQSRLVAMLRSPSGGTLEQLVELTGWQPHTVRGTISATLRKRLKLNVTCVAGSAGTRVYRIVEAQA